MGLLGHTVVCHHFVTIRLGKKKSVLNIERINAEPEAPILWPTDAKDWLIGKDPDARKDWKQEKMGTTEHELVKWHHQLNGHEFEQAMGVHDGQGSLACCSPWNQSWTLSD